jgi:hypothetical protein
MYIFSIFIGHLLTVLGIFLNTNTINKKTLFTERYTFFLIVYFRVCVQSSSISTLEIFIKFENKKL